MKEKKSQSIIACSLRTIFQIFNTISSGKNGGRRGEGELQPNIEWISEETFEWNKGHIKRHSFGIIKPLLHLPD